MLEDSQRRKDASLRKIVESAFKQTEAPAADLKAEAPDQLKHYIALGAFLVIWVGFILYQNFGLFGNTGDNLQETNTNL
jgi:hypothetical protein